MDRQLTLMVVIVFSLAVYPELTAAEPQLVSVKKIWDAGKHNAFTDLARHHNCWWVTFREAEKHGKSNGKVRVIVSADGGNWRSAALISQLGVDLRDPKLSVMPDGRLLFPRMVGNGQSQLSYWRKIIGCGA